MKILGITDERDSCDCCGKNGLKRTVALETAMGEFVFYGTTCAANALKRPAKDVRTEARTAQAARDDAARAAREAEAAKRHEAWVSFLVERTGGRFQFDGAPDVVAMIAAAGGFAAARAAFAEK